MIWTEPYRTIFTLLLAAWAMSEIFVGRLGLHALSLESDRGSALAVLLSGLGGLAGGFAFAQAGVAPIGVGWLQIAGLVVMILGLGLRVLSIWWLGPYFTRFVQVLPGHRLVQNGPYRFIRHPSYSGLLLFFVGVGLALGSWLSLFALALLPPLGVAYRIKIEESAMLEAFGDEYKAYMKRVRGIVPFVL